MNLTEAKRILSGKLVFGNESQVQAVRFMEKVNECCEAIEACEYEHQVARPSWQEARECICTSEFELETIDAAIAKLNGGS